jgi:hypothetical protein
MSKRHAALKRKNEKKPSPLTAMRAAQAKAGDI